MAYFTIENLKATKGESRSVNRYRANVREKIDGKVVFSRKKTFRKKSDATQWAKEIVTKVESGEIKKTSSQDYWTFGQLIDEFITTMKSGNKPLGRTQTFALRQVKRYKIATVKAVDLKSHHILDFCSDRIHSKNKPSPQTIAFDVSTIRTVLFHAKSLFNLDITQDPIIDSYASLKRLGYLGRSVKRDRRLKAAEYETLLHGLKHYQAQKKAIIPIAILFEMSILTCLRISELCALRWEDLRASQSAIWVRDRKHPSQKTGNSVLLPLLGRGRALDLILAQPRETELIFPYNARSATTAFRRVARSLGITDLRYHDLRREGCTRLIEQGFSLSEVAMVSGHRDLKILHNIYVSLSPKSLVDKEATMLSTT